MRRRAFVSLAAAAGAGLLIGGCSVDSNKSSTAANSGKTVDSVIETDAGGLKRYKSPVPLADTIETRGPDGETPVWYRDVKLTPEEVEKVKKGNYRAAIVWHTSSPFMNALATGVKETFEQLGVQVIATTDANMDQPRLANDVQSVLALKPDLIVTIALDPVADFATFKPAVDQGVKLVFASVKPKDFKAGKDYISLVTYDLKGLGDVTAKALGDDLGGKAKIGQIFYDANFFVVNERERAFEQTLKAKYPGIEVVERAPMADPAKVEDIASAMIARHPDIKAIFAPWDTAAEGVVAALRNAGRQDIGVYTIDLGNTNALDMARGGLIKEMTSTLAVEFGHTLAISGAYGLLGKQAPPMAVVPAFPVTKKNLKQGWESTFGVTLPADIAAASK
ncbi:substrate-binding domain-containing protein [Planosporangium flavigriseum]|uniref:Sugar ABC transporter substrate-binding protein n=1 Tax=Planosporangium flavigriseum TaxID=373681 RepID=A0A8J3M0K0_9ACTN|nr:substrate-binding domain-containing protein [Planosporangium flavigriseum]NJC63128.1 substrate-binding domain-containing protein [Planosporangium flavigriseum]GIG74505.1 sugar ABC transporter substrate-binding protein [Planosporangium flavigriseum]